VSRPIPNSPEFSRLAAGDEGADLTLIALEIARDARPGLDPAPYLDRIDALADRVRPRVPVGASTEEILRQVNWVLFVEEQFSGNEEDYHDPRNSDLSEVIERRTGIPISLSLLYRAVAGRLGLGLRGVNLPVHFVLRADREDGGAIFIDAFHAGALLDQDGCRRLIASRAGSIIELLDEQFLPCSASEVVARMLRNLRAIHLQAGHVMAAEPVLRRLIALRPEEPPYRKDLGVVLMGLDRPSEAIEQLSAYLEQAEQPRDAPAVRGLILEARRQQNPDE
jgi:regulator of sirC expression with transglutaminase-like and TPR domain